MMRFGFLILFTAAALSAQTTPTLVASNTDEIPRDTAPLQIVPMSFQDQTAFYLRHSFDAGSLLSPVIPAIFQMADPPDRYPRQWRDGAGAFGRNFGDALAAETAAHTGKYLAASVLHEDPRYYPDTDKRALHRLFHALAFTVIDRSTAGTPRLAIANFAGALAGGFVGRAYLPQPYADTTHALQRASGILGGYLGTQLVGCATGNIVEEFKPELTALARKLHLPFIK